MNFDMAVKLLNQGERIKRGHWKAAYLKMNGSKLMMHMGGRNPWHYHFKNADITAKDWLIHVDNSFIDDFADRVVDDSPRELTGKLRYRNE